MKIRDYTPTDSDRCVEIFKSNQPKFFADNELPDFVEFLGGTPHPYYCLVEDETIVGCGGYWIHKDVRKAVLTWGMIANDRHRQGLGKRLTVYRLRQICTSQKADSIQIDTSQHTFEFYQKLGFEVDKITPDGYAQGLDQYDMVLTITTESCQKIQEIFDALN